MVILPIIFGVAVLGKNSDGSKFLFVNLIALFTFLSDIGNLVYDAVFVCQSKLGSIDSNDPSITWFMWSTFFSLLKNWQSYVFLVFLF